MQDDYGSIEYVLPFDGWDYRQPAITRIGECCMDVERFERKCAELQPVDDEEPGVWILGAALISERERFVAVRESGKNVLILEQHENALWQEVWRNPHILPDEAYDWVTLQAYPDRETQLHEYVRFSAEREETLSIYAGYNGEDSGALEIQMERKSGETWQVNAYSDSDNALHLYLFDDHLLYYAAKFSAMHTAGLSFEKIERSAKRFDAEEARRRRDAFEGRMADAVHVECFAGAEPLYISLGRKVQCPVYLAPDLNIPRAADGKAAVSLNDWVVLMGWEDGWLLALYETKKGQYRMGWIDPNSDDVLVRAAEYVMPLRYEDAYDAMTSRENTLFDDPINKTGKVAVLAAGHKITVLHVPFVAAGNVQEIAYIETSIKTDAGERTVRGFVGMPL